ncbi:unconventional myosin-IXAa-like isoform X3 [Lytechinus variegatus]|uniref:unconventional myosin-IXAa-like isoform X3 n=1 Tax=Lytechinus variegatus TaxID=7654 RepID=UPI001BB25D33|nr:unconventional myosin-IXAa-like isoform X3 [Lytechinus variegatus]
MDFDKCTQSKTFCCCCLQLCHVVQTPGSTMADGVGVDDTVYAVRVHPGTVDPDRHYVVIQATKQTSTKDLLEALCCKLALSEPEEYCLSEVCQDSGQSCKERRLDLVECPVKVQLLWPKIVDSSGGDSTDSGTFQTNYRFFLRGINETPGALPDMSDMKSIDSFVSGYFPQPSASGDCHDLCKLPDLNEKTLLDNLSARFRKGKIYTYVGSILIAVNPFKFFPIYNPKYVNLYQNHRFGELPPHIFAIADAAFHTMLQEKQNQCIVISGESGSGKTESTTLLIHHLTALSQKGFASGVEQTLLGAGPVLEAFGNAKTVVNNNSSRFGKFIQINYRENGTVHGAIVEQYLLEKSRIVSQAAHERNYHVFYYLLKGASDAEKQAFWLDKPQEYFYLNQSNCYTQEGVDESYEFGRLKQSMEMVGFSKETMKRIFSVLSAVLHIGNINFRKAGEQDYVTVKNIAMVKVVSDLLKVKTETLMLALTKRKSVARGEQFFVQYRMAEAIATRNALAKGLYCALFEWIVLQVNYALLSRYEVKGEHQGNSIGVLDIFGFEDFQRNSFEQFCINFANEHLQYYFNQHVFKLEQEEYKREGIAWKDIEFIDNTGCLLLIEKRPTGIMHILDDDCNFPAKDTDGSNLLNKFVKEHSGNEYFQQVPIQEHAFIIQHYAGKVKYNIKDFREKNTDLMRIDIVSVLKNSRLAFVGELVGKNPVAVFRWAILRAFFRSVSAFKLAGSSLSKDASLKGKKRPPNLSLSVDGRDENVLSLTSRGVSPLLTSPMLLSPTSRLSLGSKPSLLYQETYLRASKVVKRNRSFRGAQVQPSKSLRDLKSVKKIAGRYSPNRRKSKKHPPTVCAQFQSSLSKLMDTLNQANPFFVRCIKSNSQKEPCRLDEELIMRQLRYTGMLETVRIRQSGYNVRLKFEEFCHKYKVLLPKQMKASAREIKTFLVSMDLDDTNYQIGKSKVFLRESERVKLQEALHAHVLQRICKIQWWYRGILARRRYLETRESIIKLQAHWRGYLDRRIYDEQRKAAIVIQAFWRMAIELRNYQKLKRGILLLQSRTRGMRARKRCILLRKEQSVKPAAVKARLRRDDEESTSQGKNRIRRTDDVHSAISDEGILTTDDIEDDLYERNRTTTMESEESSGVHEGSLGSDELLLDEPTTSSGPSHPPALGLPTSPTIPVPPSPSALLSPSFNDGVNVEVGPPISPIPDVSPLRRSLARQGKVRDMAREYMARASSQDRFGSRSSSQDRKSERDSSTERPSKQTLSSDSSVESNSSQNRTPKTVETKKLDSITPALKKPMLGGSVVSRTSSMQLTDQLADLQTVIDSLEETPFGRDDEEEEHVVEEEKKEKTVKAAEVNGGEVIVIATDDIILEEDDAEELEMEDRDKVLPIRPSPPLSPKGKVDIVVGRPSSIISDSSTTEDEVPPSSPRSPLLSDMDSNPRTPESPNAPTKNLFKRYKHNFKRRFRRSPSDQALLIEEQGSIKSTSSSKSAALNDKTNEKPTPGGGRTSPQQRKPPTGRKNSGTVNSPVPKRTRTNQGNINFHGMSQWRYPTDKLISDAQTLEQMNNFIQTKVDEMGQTYSQVDAVFKKALKKFKENLISTYSVTLHDGNVNLQYRHLMSNFEQVLSIVAKQYEDANNTTFPLTLGINAFRGFLDEFMHQYKPSDNRKKVKEPKRKKEKKEEVFEHAGHKFLSVQLGIPTACETCTNFLWLMEKGYVCQVCKYTCHKKCCSKSIQVCRGKPHGVKGIVIGGRLEDLVNEEMRIPVVLERLITTVEVNGLYTEGIYRKPGPAAKVKELKHLINSEEEVDNIDFNNYSVLVIAQVLKSFFRDMPEPLLTYQLYEEFLRATEIVDKHEKLQSLQSSIEKLPLENHDALERLIFHLARVAENENSNKMSASNLAIVFAPCILKSNKAGNAWESLQDVEKQAQCLEIIIHEKMLKMKRALHDISTLERAFNSASMHLTDLRNSLIKVTVDPSADSGHPPSTGSVGAESINSSEGGHELENVLTEQIRTLERENSLSWMQQWRDLTADLSTLNVGPIASEDDNFSADDLDASSVDDLDSGIHHDRVSFDTAASPSKLSHLNKNRAPKQKKRPPARYSMLLGQDEVEAAPAPSSSAASESKEKQPEAPPPQEKIKKKRGSKEKKQKKKGKYNKKTDAKLDDSVVEV